MKSSADPGRISTAKLAPHPPRVDRLVAGKASDTSAASPVRLHADWSEDGVRLWLGMDASASSNLAGITAHLQRWMAAQGMRVLSISCNGQLLIEGGGELPTDIFEPEIGAVTKPSAHNQKESS